MNFAQFSKISMLKVKLRPFLIMTPSANYYFMESNNNKQHKFLYCTLRQIDDMVKIDLTLHNNNPKYIKRRFIVSEVYPLVKYLPFINPFKITQIADEQFYIIKNILKTSE